MKNAFPRLPNLSGATSSNSPRPITANISGQRCVKHFPYGLHISLNVMSLICISLIKYITPYMPTYQYTTPIRSIQLYTAPYRAIQHCTAIYRPIQAYSTLYCPTHLFTALYNPTQPYTVQYSLCNPIPVYKSIYDTTQFHTSL